MIRVLWGDVSVSITTNWHGKRRQAQRKMCARGLFFTSLLRSVELNWSHNFISLASKKPYLMALNAHLEAGVLSIKKARYFF
ncbi:Uncharacterized protein ALO94_01832 [Pseudomonas syringae pv. spinaceae]|uniref:Uncharacterized protein n=1 Tax=Pseudomonas syringae pv. spinaceae TaxID=264459 RepID=A0A0N8SZZ0_PSESX|nr:Uncharacterized protein ALO94_01832 [Pseudomonas syringae pv. spinaceae]